MSKNYKLHDLYTGWSDIRDFIEDIGDRYKDKYAYSFRTTPSSPATRKTYAELRSDVRGLAAELISRGYAGKHICLVGKLSYNWVLVYYATLAIGSVLIPLDAEWHAEDLADTSSRANADLVICEEKLLPKGEAMSAANGSCEVFFLDGEKEVSVSALSEAGKIKFDSDSAPYYSVPVDTEKMSLLVFTSGTTGKGKGVMLSQKNFMSCLTSVTPYINFADKTLGLLPPHHTYGSSVSIFGHNSIGVEVYLSAGLRYITKEMKEEKPGHLVLVPLYLETFYRRVTANIKDQGKEKLVRRMMKISNFLRKFGIDLRRKFFGKILDAFGGNLKMVISGGAAINQEIISFFDGLGISVLNGYGITECAPIIAVNYSKNVVQGSVGNILDCNEVKIVKDDDGQNEEGEICVKGSNVMLGYYNDPENTKEAFDDEGNFKTGDYGKIENGVLYITGRKKNLIILSNGKNVYPEEIESEFIAVPGVLDVIVYEGQSKRGIEENKIVAEIYPDYDYMEKSGIDDVEKYLQTFVDKYNYNAVSYKKIGVLKVRKEEFPKNTLRKILRFKLDMTID